MFHSSYGRKACLNKWSQGNTKRSTAAAAPIQSSNILITKMVILFVHKRALQETKDGQRNGGKQSSLDQVCSSERQNFLFFHSSKVGGSKRRHKTDTGYHSDPKAPKLDKKNQNIRKKKKKKKKKANGERSVSISSGVERAVESKARGFARGAALEWEGSLKIH